MYFACDAIVCSIRSSSPIIPEEIDVTCNMKKGMEHELHQELADYLGFVKNAFPIIFFPMETWNLKDQLFASNLRSVMVPR